MDLRTQTIVGLALVSLLDVVIPLPISGALLIYVVLQRPPWFIETVERIYGR